METNEKRVEVKVTNGGPLIIKGPVKLVLPNGEESLTEKAFLCRCGKSANQPYCDGAHAQ